MPTATLTLSLPSEEIEFLQRYAQQHGLTVAEVVAGYLKRLRSGAEPEIHPEVPALAGLVPPDDQVVTRNVADFAGSPVPALTPTEFLKARSQ
jgi:hypothetical protein